MIFKMKHELPILEGIYCRTRRTEVSRDATGAYAVAGSKPKDIQLQICLEAKGKSSAAKMDGYNTYYYNKYHYHEPR